MVNKLNKTYSQAHTQVSLLTVTVGNANVVLKLYYAHLNTFVQSYDIASEALNNYKKIHYMY